MQPDLSNLPEATKEFCAKTVVVGSGKFERLNVGVSVVNFRVGGISSKQVQQLTALEYLM